MGKNKVLDSFMNDKENSFMDQFEIHIERNLSKRKEYKELQDLIEDLQLKYPKVQEYLENERITDMTDEEKEAVLRIIELYRSMKVIELKESFKLGGKEMLIYLNEMAILNF